MSFSLSGPALVLLDHHEGHLRPPVLELVTAARSLGVPVEGVWFGDGVEATIPALGRAGITRVYRVGCGAASAVGADLRQSVVAADALVAVVTEQRPALVLLTSTFDNKEIAARLGAATGAGVVVDAGALAIEDGQLVAVKANSIHAEDAAQETTPDVVDVVPALSGRLRPVTLSERSERPTSERPELGEAEVVIAGGRGTGGDFSFIEQLADLLGAGVGGTRVATDEGWIDRGAEIGQTGVTVAPRLYIGAGVSGAVHHRGGMQSAGTIVAVNSDPEAPIFEIADYGIVGDLFTVLPQTIAELHRIKEPEGSK